VSLFQATSKGTFLRRDNRVFGLVSIKGVALFKNPIALIFDQDLAIVSA
jgi:hypothetical protein